MQMSTVKNLDYRPVYLEIIARTHYNQLQALPSLVLINRIQGSSQCEQDLMNIVIMPLMLITFKHLYVQRSIVIVNQPNNRQRLL